MKLHLSSCRSMGNRSQRDFTTPFLRQALLFLPSHCSWIQTLPLSITTCFFGWRPIVPQLASAQPALRPAPENVRGALWASRIRARADSDNKICRWRGAHILDPMFVIGVHKPHRAGPEPVARAVDRQFDRPFPD